MKKNLKEGAKLYLIVAEQCLHKIKKNKLNVEKSFNLLRENDLEDGLCSFLENNNFKSEYMKIDKFIPSCSIYWCQTPRAAFYNGTRKEMIQAVEKRMEIIRKHFI